MSSLWGVLLIVLILNEVQRCQSRREVSREAVTCRDNDMILLIPKHVAQSTLFLYVQDRNGNYHNMRDIAAQCLYDLSESPGFLFLRVSYSSCHVQRVGGVYILPVIVKKLRYEGDILKRILMTCSVMQPPNAQVKAGDTRHGAACHSKGGLNMIISQNATAPPLDLRSAQVEENQSVTKVAVKDSNSTMSTIIKKGVLRAQIRFATDSSFKSFYKSQGPPVMHILGEPVFVEIFVLKHEDQDLVLLLDDCWATPSADPQDKRRWNLLHKGCPQQGADYSVEVLEVMPGDGVKYPKLHNWLKIKMFSFLETEDVYESVYLHCDAEVCKGALCQRTCDRKRHQSSVQ